MPASDLRNHRLQLPARPTVPLTLLVLIVFIVVARNCLREGDCSSVWRTALLFALLVLLAGLISLIAKRAIVHSSHPHAATIVESFTSLAALSCAALCACILSAVCLGDMQRSFELLAQTEIANLPLTIESDPSASTYGWTVDASIVLDHTKAHVALSISGDATLEACPVRRGEVVHARGSFVALTTSDYDVSLRMRGVCGRVRVRSIVDHAALESPIGWLLSWRASMLETLKPQQNEARALIAGIVFGYRESLKEDGLQDVFARCGLSHLIAVSGSHLAQVAALCALLFSRISCKRPTKHLLTAIILGVFVILSGMAPSALRAWIMVLVALLGDLLGRRTHSLSAVACAGLILCFQNVAITGQLGFLLSLVSVASLGLYVRWVLYATEILTALPEDMTAKLSIANRNRLENLRSSFAASLTCQLATLPLCVPIFGSVSLIAPLANLLVAPLLSICISVGLLEAALTSLSAPDFLIVLCELPVRAMLGLTEFIASASKVVNLSAFSQLIGPLVCLVGLVILLLWPKLQRKKLLGGMGAVAVLFVAFFVCERYFAPARIVMLDVGQGDAIVIQEGSQVLLVDAGPSDEVADALARAHINHVDAVLLTHQHADHFEGISALQDLGIQTLFVAQGVANQLSDELKNCLRSIDPQLVELKDGDTMQVGGFTLNILFPTEAVDGDENAESLCFELTHVQGSELWRAYFCGDAEEDELQQILCAGKLGDIDLLKVGHHGSKVSISKEEARQLKPELALVSAGKGNRYGHPSAQCKEILEDAGATFLCTIEHGSIEVRPAAHNTLVWTER